jgi:ankyrin repeat protein
VQILSKQDDFLIEFEFTPIQIAVLDLYGPSDSERPSLEKLIDFVDEANNAEPGANWTRWKVEYKKRSPLFLAIIEQFRVSAVENPNTRKVIHNLLDQKDRKFHWTPLHWASSTGRADKMKILIDAGADPFIMSNLNANIIHAALESNALESLAYSLKISKDHPTRLNIDHPNIWGETPLIMAAQGCLVDCVRLLLEAGANKNVRQENQQVALHYAGLSKRGAERRKTVALLCAGSNGSDESSAHINAQDEDGRPPIFNFLDDPECMELLICHGARLDLRDNSGKNIFHHAGIQDDCKQLTLLLQLSATSARDSTEKDNDGNTPLVETLRHNSISCAKTLLELPDVGDMVGQDGWSAVHYATRIGDSELLEMVLKHPGYEKGAKTGDGKTIQVVAMESGNWCGKVKELLRRYNSIV